ncbi:hypothetical protein [Pseudonocardia sp. T1-2H]|uniref:hypothetical protein n=1 Tax=Pseudonocardia sp. T1-2H TaxID=3128899 RepID=UPI003101522A
MTELPSLPALDDHDDPGSLTCAVCSWTASDGWVAAHDLPTWDRDGEAPAPFALCGFCLHSPSVARWLDVRLDVMPHTLELLVAMNVLRANVRAVAS